MPRRAPIAKLLFAALLGVALAGACEARGQSKPTGVWTHAFEEYRAYLVVTPIHLEVWALRDGTCTMYPALVRWPSSTRMEYPKTGTTWHMRRHKGRLQVTFPDSSTVQYRRTRQDPRALCLGSHDI
jgi:hypothetical protein